ncbi:MAG TPA: hypothetical protein VFJ27_02800 [Terriglobia bacterium]|nr:hypothetical protein [Terriglobia bacterium]
MTGFRNRTRLAAAFLFIFSFPLAGVIRGGEWTSPVEVRHDVQKCVSYRARLTGDFLVIQATHEAGWHTFAMDNKLRAQERLAGKRSLGIDGPTEILVAQGLEVAGPWYQSVPKEFSKPELRWYSWGFEGQALFVAKARRVGAGPASVSVRGQACSETTCKNIDLTISVPLGGDTGKSDIDLKSLVQVR